MHFCNKEVNIITVFHTFVQKITILSLSRLSGNVASHLIKGKEGTAKK